jgi:hypothetical protein
MDNHVLFVYLRWYSWYHYPVKTKAVSENAARRPAQNILLWDLTYWSCVEYGVHAFPSYRVCESVAAKVSWRHHWCDVYIPQDIRRIATYVPAFQGGVRIIGVQVATRRLQGELERPNILGDRTFQSNESKTEQQRGTPARLQEVSRHWPVLRSVMIDCKSLLIEEVSTTQIVAERARAFDAMLRALPPRVEHLKLAQFNPIGLHAKVDDLPYDRRSSTTSYPVASSVRSLSFDPMQGFVPGRSCCCPHEFVRRVWNQEEEEEASETNYVSPQSFPAVTDCSVKGNDSCFLMSSLLLRPFGSQLQRLTLSLVQTPSVPVSEEDHEWATEALQVVDALWTRLTGLQHLTIDPVPLSVPHMTRSVAHMSRLESLTLGYSTNLEAQEMMMTSDDIPYLPCLQHLTVRCRVLRTLHPAVVDVEEIHHINDRWWERNRRLSSITWTTSGRTILHSNRPGCYYDDDDDSDDFANGANRSLTTSASAS